MFNLNNDSIGGSIIRNMNAREPKNLKESGFPDLKTEKKVKPRVTGADKIATGKEENKAKCIKESDAIAEILGKKYNLTEEQSKELSALVEKAFIAPLAEAETGYDGGEDKFEWLKHQFENRTWKECDPETHKTEDIQPGDTKKEPGKGTTKAPETKKVDPRSTGADKIAQGDEKDKLKVIKESENSDWKYQTDTGEDVRDTISGDRLAIYEFINDDVPLNQEDRAECASLLQNVHNEEDLRKTLAEYYHDNQIDEVVSKLQSHIGGLAECDKNLTEEVILDGELNPIEGEELAFNNTAAEVLAHLADTVGEDVVLAADYGDGAKLYYKSSPDADFDTAVDIQVEETKGDDDQTITKIVGETDLDTVVENIKSQIGGESPEDVPAEEPTDAGEPADVPVDGEEVPEDLPAEGGEDLEAEPEEPVEEPEE